MKETSNIHCENNVDVVIPEHSESLEGVSPVFFRLTF